jgi:hypothetical protein
MRAGRCLCGVTAYELTVEPQMLAFCHCRDCQYVSGGEPAAVAVAPAGSFRLTKGELKVYRTQGDSGGVADRHFCPECGTHIVSRLESGPFLAVKAGTLDEPLSLQPQMEIWTASAQPWAHHPDGAARFDRNPS